MRAPSWMRDFIRWRWAPCATLIAGSIAFIAVVLLLMPKQPAVTARSVNTLPTFDAPSVTSPARVAFNASVAREVGPAAEPPELPAATPLAPAAAPAPIATAPPSPVTQPDFAANIADRGDRPRAPTR